MYRLSVSELARHRAELERARRGLEKDGFVVMAKTKAEHAKAAWDLHDRIQAEYREQQAKGHAPASELTHVERVVASVFGRSKAHMINARSKR